MKAPIFLYISLLISSFFLSSCISNIPLIHPKDHVEATALPDTKHIRKRGNKSHIQDYSSPESTVILPENSVRTHGPKIPVTEFDISGNNASSDLILRRDDALEFRVWQYPELNATAQIQKNGFITFPLTGQVEAAGKTLDELLKTVLEKLREKHAEGPFRLSYDDQVNFSVWRHPDLTYTAVVQPDGKLTLPLVGEVDGAGKTLEEVKKAVTEKIKGFVEDPVVSILPVSIHLKTLMDPQISILPSKLSAREIVVLGEVLFPGAQPMKEDSQVTDALARSHYFEACDLNNVIVIRNASTQKPQYRRLKIGDYLKGRAPDQNIFLHPDDIIMLPKTKIEEVGDFVNRYFARTEAIFSWKLGLDAARFGDDFPGSLTSVRSRVRQVESKSIDSRIQRILDASIDKKINERIGESVDTALDDAFDSDFDARLNDAVTQELGQGLSSDNLDFLLQGKLEEQLQQNLGNG